MSTDTDREPDFPHHWRPVGVREVRSENRELDNEHVERLLDSFERLGGQLQLQPIVLDRSLVLIDGAHRLEAARRAGWSHVSALIVDDSAADRHRLMELEANRVRRQLSPLELESVWREHYEPELRARARARRRAGLRRGSPSAVIGNSNNGKAAGGGPEGEIRGEHECGRDRVAPGGGGETVPAESIARAARLVTGLSIDTLGKISAIRAAAAAKSNSDTVRTTAGSALRSLSRPGASVDSAYRQVLEQLSREQMAGSSPAEVEFALCRRSLERALADSTLLAERLEGAVCEQLETAARSGHAEREQLRAVRVALARSLATVVSAECRLETDPKLALRRLGAEVGRLLSAVSAAKLEPRGRAG